MTERGKESTGKNYRIPSRPEQPTEADIQRNSDLFRRIRGIVEDINNNDGKITPDVLRPKTEKPPKKGSKLRRSQQ